MTEADVRKLGAPRSRPAVASGEPVVAAEPPASAGPSSDVAAKQAALRRAIGALMARSKREIPHYYLSTIIDMRAASEWLEHVNAGRTITDRLVMPVLLLKATARAVATVPEMNGFMIDGRFEASVGSAGWGGHLTAQRRGHRTRHPRHGHTGTRSPHGGAAGSRHKGPRRLAAEFGDE